MVVFCLKNGHLEMEVGNSVETRPDTNPDGIGIANVQRQLELLYPGKSRLELKYQPAHYPKQGEQFKALLELDLN